MWRNDSFKRRNLAGGAKSGLRFGTIWNSSRVGPANERHQSLYNDDSGYSVHYKFTTRFFAFMRSSRVRRRRFVERIRRLVPSIASARQNQTDEEVGRSQRNNA